MKLTRLLYVSAFVLLFLGTMDGLIAQRAGGQSDVRRLLGNLQGIDWRVRADAYLKLRADAETLARADVRRAFLDLFERENTLVASTLRESHETVGVSQKYGEEFSLYVAELGDTVDSFIDWTDPRQVCVVVRGGFAPESPFGVALASRGRIVAECLLNMYRTEDVGVLRADAPPVLVRMLWGQTVNPLDPVTARAARSAVVAALHDANERVRSQTVLAVGTFADSEMIPELRRIANSDPAIDRVTHARWIREHAVHAINEIRARASAKSPEK